MTRSVPDSCPGVLRLHEAADGPLARIRIPAGMLRPDQLQVLAAAAHDLGDDHIELTSRGNVQLRRMHDAAALAERLDAVGLLPSATHERVRNIVASPLSGRVGGPADVRALVPALDDGLRSSPDLAELPGRVLFTLDDGRGDVSGLGGDIGVHAVGENEYALLLGGTDTGIRLPGDAAVGTLLAAAHAFQDLRGEHWRLHEIPGGPALVAEQLGLNGSTARLGLGDSAAQPGPNDSATRPGPDGSAAQPGIKGSAARPRTGSGAPLEIGARHAIPIGWFTQADGRVALGAGVPLGSLPARTAEFVAAVDRPVIVTPWRSLVLADLDEWAAEQVVRVLAPMGLLFDADSPWLQVTACAGKPGCAKSRTDVRADLAEAIAQGRIRPGAPPPSVADGSSLPANQPPPATGLAAADVSVAGRQHWSGCDRRCGRPKGPVTDVVAEPGGYRIAPPAESAR
ncbi:precorrin-3B synthase [Nocardia transvalensis]|uniref:Precorrin-3B synthase n=1 Tax=Nocardia transvalensis TaxID=37333 RepID=A0A7W9PK79_9NOCA|nr:nitrite/sulfite reductase [Nocardia transvalensis]MBB5917033.1 precorrin-3B synthase [Nocardia transvalensis]